MEAEPGAVTAEVGRVGETEAEAATKAAEKVVGTQAAVTAGADWAAAPAAKAEPAEAAVEE